MRVKLGHNSKKLYNHPPMREGEKSISEQFRERGGVWIGSEQWFQPGLNFGAVFAIIPENTSQELVDFLHS